MSINNGVLVHGSADQVEAWQRAAGDKPVATWLADIASAAAASERAWPVTVDLKYPVDLGSQRIESLTFRRGRAGDIKGMQLSDKVPADQLFLVASRMCGQTVKVIEMLDADDASEVIAIALDFFGKCLGGGRKG